MIGVSPKQVKTSAAPTQLPQASTFKLVQTPGRIARSAFASLDHLLVVVPKQMSRALASEIPALAAFEPVIRRLGREACGRPLRGMFGKTPATLGLLPEAEAARAGSTSAGRFPNAFQRLKFAGELVADALRDRPRTIGLIVHGFAADDAEKIAQALLLALGAHAWQGPDFRKKTPSGTLRAVHLIGQPNRLDVRRTLAEIEGANLARWLTLLPANTLDASTYRAAIEELAKRHGWTFRWLDEASLAKLGAGAFLAVAQGNAHRTAGIAHLKYRPAARGARTDTRRAGRAARPSGAPEVALVGKGIIFDTGGTNTKSATHMLDMHMDMSGSAVALGVLQTLTALDSPVSVDCWLAITENRSGPTAYKQRDVVTASNGVTIEIVHTDAEGRMVLADTLALAGRENPGLIVDYATLTGACVNALSERYSGVFSNREAFNEVLVRAGRDAGERVWPFPMDEDFDDDLKSKIADVAQCSLSNEADHILAARFLERFVPRQTPWIHVDLSAVMRKDGLAHVPSGSTGFGVRYSTSLLLDHVAELRARLATGTRPQ